MRVVPAVASVAVGRRISEGKAGGMALVAFDAHMAAGQREARAVMVEGLGLPAVGGMAGVAALAELALVALPVVVLLVAGEAGAGRLGGVERDRVAGIALGLHVLAAQRIFGVAVVIEPDVLPALGGMAGLALAPEVALVALKTTLEKDRDRLKKALPLCVVRCCGI